MAKNKVNFRDLSDAELQQRSRDLGEELFNLRFQVSMSMAKNPARIGKVRRDIARIKTIQRERVLGLTRG
jgi:large subunit ribosomal protein L29